MPQFTIRSIIVFTALLMAYVVLLTHLPAAAVVPLLGPGVISVVFLPCAIGQLVLLMTDPCERTLSSTRVQNGLWCIFVCLFAFCPFIALWISVVGRGF